MVLQNNRGCTFGGASSTKREMAKRKQRVYFALFPDINEKDEEKKTLTDGDKIASTMTQDGSSTTIQNKYIDFLFYQARCGGGEFNGQIRL